MNENHRLPNYLDPIQQAATDARSFMEGLTFTQCCQGNLGLNTG